MNGLTESLLPYRELPNESVTVLLAIDDRSLVSALSLGLRSAGFSINQANTGQAALDMCLLTPPTIAVLGQDRAVGGIAVAEQLRDSKRLPIVIVADSRDETMVSRAWEAGAMAYLVKPIDSTRMIPAIRTALRRFADNESLRAETRKLAVSLQQAKSTSVAVGILMERLQLSEKDAYERLRLFARSQSSKVSDVASDVLTHAGNFNTMVARIASMNRKLRGGAESA